LLVVGRDGQIHLHGDPAAPRLAVARVGSETSDRPAWIALVAEETVANPFGDVAFETTSSLAPRTETGAATVLTEHQLGVVAAGNLIVRHTDAGPDSFYNAVLEASGGAIQIDRETLVSTPGQLKQQLAALLGTRPDLLDAATREAIERDTAVREGASTEELIDALTDPANHDAEVIAGHLLGTHLGLKLTILKPDGTKSGYGTEEGRPIEIASATEDPGESHWVALVPEQRTVEQEAGQDESGDALADHTLAVKAERIEIGQWSPEEFTLSRQDQDTGPWRSATFCATVVIDGEEVAACVSVAAFTLDAELAAQLGVKMP
jgi:hypothetical protein